MDSGGPNWSGLLKWSLTHSDGTSAQKVVSAEEQAWFREAMKEMTGPDETEVMKQIGAFLTHDQHPNYAGVCPLAPLECNANHGSSMETSTRRHRWRRRGTASLALTVRRHRMSLCSITVRVRGRCAPS
jgi:hypothetical protein